MYSQSLQDFQFLVSNPREQVLQIEVNDSLGFGDMAIGTGEVNYISLAQFLFVICRIVS